MTRSFNPNDYMMDLRGKDYLPVAPRLAWVNHDQENGNVVPLSKGGALHISTEMLQYGPEKVTVRGKEIETLSCVFRATVTVYDTDGAVVKCATSHKRQTQQDFADFVEKAETGAIGRALAAAGYGTIQSLDFEEGEKVSPIDGQMGPGVVDAPYAKPDAKKRGKKEAETPAAAPAATPAPAVMTPPPMVAAPAAPAEPAGEFNREEALTWLQPRIGDPRVATLLNAAIEEAKQTNPAIDRVSLLPDELLQRAWASAQALSASVN